MDKRTQSFKDGFAEIRQNLNDRYYTSVATFETDIMNILQPLGSAVVRKPGQSYAALEASIEAEILASQVATTVTVPTEAPAINGSATADDVAGDIEMEDGDTEKLQPVVDGSAVSPLASKSVNILPPPLPVSNTHPAVPPLPERMG